ncbi:MAG: helix-turn-helix domain-containing protein [Planctomycetes bacterium]|nr:helix-turn-helix domain-containing protein [Planctomycetota bacterium]
MTDYTLSKEKIAELEKLHRSLRDKRQTDRVKAVIALSKGWPAAQIAEILLFDEKTSRSYFERYQQGGLPALLDNHYRGAEPKLDENQVSELQAHLEENIFPDAKSVIAYIQKQ